MSALRRFFATESAGGVVMMIAALVALLVANSPLDRLYDEVLRLRVGGQLGPLDLDKTVLHWINDGLMAIFFLLVGLEIKREIVAGELSSRERLALPVIAALGGMIVPALIFAAINRADALALRGWAIPTATDIAFSLAVLSLFGTRVPLALKVFLTAVAIVDDLGAIAVIAIFYTEDLSSGMLASAAVLTALLVLLNVLGVRRLPAYLAVGALLWLCVLKSGVHATLAGVATALTIPFADDRTQSSPGARLETALHPWVAFLVLPVFALANAGVSLRNVGFETLLEPIPLGILTGLLFGKAIGIFGSAALTIRVGIAPRPEGGGWITLLGIATIGGVGFTMSLFVGSLAYESHPPAYYELVKLGVVAGSLVSAAAGAALLALGLSRDSSSSRTRSPPSR